MMGERHDGAIESDEPVDAVDDDTLMARVKAGDTPAFERLIERYHRRVFAFATRFLGDDSCGEELTQEVFLTLWSERDRYQPRGKLQAYLFALAFKRACALSRRERNLRARHQAALVQRPVSHTPTALDALLCESHAAEARRHLAELPFSMRRVLVLRFGNGLSLTEIAAFTETPLGTVKSHLFRGLKRLRAAMAGDES